MNNKKHMEDILYYFEKYHYENMILDDNEAKFIHDYIINLQSKIDKAIEYIEKDTRWFDYEYASVYGELCDCEGYNANRLEVMVNTSIVLNILKEDK